MGISMAVMWPAHRCCRVKTRLPKIAGPSRLMHNSRAAMHDLSQDCGSVLSSGVPQSDPGPLA